MYIRRALRLLSPLLCASVVLGSAPATANPAFDAWAEHFAADWIRLSPEWSTGLQYFHAAEQASLDRLLTPQTQERRDRERALATEGQARLDRWLAGELTPEQRNGAATMRWSLSRSVQGQRFDDHGFAFNQLWGVHVRQVNLFTESHPLRRATDVPSYLARLALAPQQLDEAIARSRLAASRGLVAPRVIIERARTQVQAMLAPAAGDHAIVAALAQRTGALADLSPEIRDHALDRARTLVGEQLRPAWQRVLDLLDDLHAKAGDDAGLWRLPDGDAAYAAALAANTTTSMTADEIHALGLREVARIETEMDHQLRALGHAQGSVNQRITKLNASLQPPAEPDPRAPLLARYAQHVADAQWRSQALFRLQPRAPIEVRRVPSLTEHTASAHYTTPAADGSRPGIFWMPLPGPTFNILGMRSLAIHEAVPGHHYQLALMQETANLPRWRQRRVFSGGSAHSEGWALYAEYLAIEQGWYEGDPHSLLGALNSQLFRARRLVVDTGLHAKRWTREQAIAYGIGASEVERYMANPGQACAYMVGMLRILALRDEARKALGPRFTLPDFHDVVLRAGSVPLDVLDEVVRSWITTQTRA